MISNSVITAMIITVVISALAMIVPFGIIFFTSRKKETGAWSSLGLGVLGQFWSQYLLLIPVVALLTIFGWFKNLSTDNSYYLLYVIITSIILVILAALGMVWGVWLMNRHTPSLYRAMCTGIGFAGVKVFSLIVSYVSYIGYCKEINSTGIEAFKSNMLSNSNTLDAESVDNLITQLTDANVINLIMEGINIVFMVAVEVALAALIYEGLIRKKLLKAAVIATGINFVYVFSGTVIGALSTDKLGNIISKSTGSIIYDVFMLIWGLVSIWFVYGAVCRYKIVLKEGPYAHYAYFEKKDNEA